MSRCIEIEDETGDLEIYNLDHTVMVAKRHLSLPAIVFVYMDWEVNYVYFKTTEIRNQKYNEIRKILLANG